MSLNPSVHDELPAAALHRQETSPAVANRHPQAHRRVALLTNEIPPYRVPVYRELAATPGWDFEVFTCIDREQDRLWNVEDTFPFATRRSASFSYKRTVRRSGPESYDDIRQIHLPVGLFKDLYRFSPDVVISAELGARTLIAATYTRLLGRKLITYFEGTPHTEQDLTRAQRLLRSRLCRLPNGYLVNGRQGRAYLEGMGVTSQSIFEIGQAIDTESFVTPIAPDVRKALRTKLGIRGHAYLCCGRLIPLKGLDQLLEAWKVFSDGVDGEVTLVLAGDGSERNRLERRVVEAGLSNVRFLGHLQREELPQLYHAVDVLIFPALIDCWALVVAEAMASGIPVINSIYTGSVELTVEGETGWIIDPHQVSEITDKLWAAWHARTKRDTFRSAVQARIAEQDVKSVAARMCDAVEYVSQLNRTTSSKS